MTAAVALLGLTAWADLANGEWAKNLDGTPAMSGQPTLDHLFVRSFGNENTIDNVVSFGSSDTQIVWLWLDDDEIYQNEQVQALPPIPYNAAGDLYNEITYNSFQCDIYLPEAVSLIRYENEDGDEADFVQGDRMPSSSMVVFQESSQRKIIDGSYYRVYTLLCTSTADYGCHFSSKNAPRYKANGALKKDDAPLLGIILHLDEDAHVTNEMPNMIIANLEFGIREAYTVVPQWDPNDSRFIYGTGGNNESQRFQYYHRVRLFGANGYELTETPVISYNITSSSVIVTASGQGDVKLMIDGAVVSNPCTIARGEEDVTITATATAQEQGKDVSDMATMTIVIPALATANGGNNVLSMPSAVMVEAGHAFDLPVALENTVGISALQFDVYLPAGFTMGEDGVSMVEGRVAQSHNASVRNLGNSTYRVLLASPQSEVFIGNEGDIVVLHVDVAPDVVENDYNVMLGNIILADAAAVTYTAPDVDATVIVKRYAKGDANGDGMVNVGDYVTTANYILALSPDPFVFSAADVDENSTVDVGDLVGIINILLGDFAMSDNAPCQDVDQVSLSGVTASTGENCATLTLDLKNEIPLTAWQMDVGPFVGFTLTGARLATRACSHSLAMNDLGNGYFRLLASSAVNELINGHEGALLTLEIEGADAGDAMILVKNIVMAEPDMTTHEVKAFLINECVPISVNELMTDMRIYARGEDIVVETPVKTPVEIIMINGMSRTFNAKAGVNIYTAARGINIVRVAGKVAKLTI